MKWGAIAMSQNSCDCQENANALHSHSSSVKYLPIKQWAAFYCVAEQLLAQQLPFEKTGEAQHPDYISCPQIIQISDPIFNSIRMMSNTTAFPTDRASPLVSFILRYFSFINYQSLLFSEESFLRTRIGNKRVYFPFVNSFAH